MRMRSKRHGARAKTADQVKHRLRDLDRLIAEAEADPIVDTGRIAKII